MFFLLEVKWLLEASRRFGGVSSEEDTLAVF